MLPHSDVDLTLRFEDRGNVVQPRELVVKAVDKCDIGTRVAQTGLGEGPTKPESMVH